jgi:Carboxypeptidase regulatory-like domain/TonB dependent receptor
MRRTSRCCLLILLVATIAASAFGQTSSSTTATIRGKVTNQAGAPLANAEVDVVGVSSGFVRTGKTGPDGSFNLGGITPGEVNVVVAAPGFDARTQLMRILVGQNLEVNFVMTTTQVLNEQITVVGNQAVETRTAEAATNVTPVQMENLPQDDRNFLNFAALAPGIRLSTDPLNKTIAGDAQPAEQTNLFIDGVSFKNDVLLGGSVGENSSRGNPFPLNAVQEFRVITQNYSAQYEKSSSAIITAITKSGGNTFSGQVFAFYQPKNWVAPTPIGFQFSTLTTNATYHRTQPGFSFGGPILKDHLNYFFSYEGDDEHATTTVVPQGPLASQFSQFRGAFPSPFKSTLFFGKLSWQPASNQVVDFSTNYRREHETRDFGGTTSFQSGTDLRNWVYGGTVRDQWNSATQLNQASLSLQTYGWNPTPLNPTLVGLNYEGAIRIGGNSTTQEFDQRRIELRDDFNLASFKLAGEHQVQVGGNLDAMHYKVNKSLNGNPQFDFRNNPNDPNPLNRFSFAQPYQAEFGFGNPILTTNNNELGLYGQDTWTVNNRLTVNLGLRWDYESHMLDENYVTPANIVAGLTGKISSDYFSNGSQRKAYKDEFQPRLGFTYDLRGDNKSILFGGFGRYYDRLFLNATLDERYRLQYPVYQIEFAPLGATTGTNGQVVFNPNDLTVAGLNALIASGAAHPEVYLLDNNTKPPYSNQFNLGVRQTFGSWVGSASYNGVRGYRGFTWLSATGICCSALVPGFGNVIISDPTGKRYWYNGEYLTFDRPFSAKEHWGAHFAWTHAKAEQNGNDLFSLDYPSASAYPKHEVPYSERDRITASGIFGLPWDIRFSTILGLGTGGAYNVLDFTQGFDLPSREITQPFKNSIRPPKTWGFADRSVDFRAEKDFPAFRATSVGLVAEVFNAFNWTSYGCVDAFEGPPAGSNTNFGNPGCVIRLGRREQVGLKINF